MIIWDQFRSPKSVRVNSGHGSIRVSLGHRVSSGLGSPGHGSRAVSGHRVTGQNKVDPVQLWLVVLDFLYPFTLSPFTCIRNASSIFCSYSVIVTNLIPEGETLQHRKSNAHQGGVTITAARPIASAPPTWISNVASVESADSDSEE